jgi:hypothetical protein
LGEIGGCCDNDLAKQKYQAISRFSR